MTAEEDSPDNVIDRLRFTPAEVLLDRMQERVRESSIRPGHGDREQFLFARYPELLDEAFRFRAGDEETLTPLVTVATDVDDLRVENEGERFDADPDAARQIIDQQFVSGERVLPYREYDDIKPYVFNGDKTLVTGVEVTEEDGDRVATVRSVDSDYGSLLTSRAQGAEIYRSGTRNGLRLDGETATPLRDARGDTVEDLLTNDTAGSGVLVATVLNREDGPHELLLARRSASTTVERGRWSTRVSGDIEPGADDPIRTRVVDEFVEELLGGERTMEEMLDDERDDAAREFVDAALDDGRAHLRRLGVQLNPASGDWQFPVLFYAEDEAFAERLADESERTWEQEDVERVELPVTEIPDEITPGMASYGAVGAVGLALERLRDEFGVEVGDVEAGPVESREQAVAALAGRADVDLTREDGEVGVAPPGRVETDDPVLDAYRTAVGLARRVPSPGDLADGVLSTPEVVRSGGRRLGLDETVGEIRRVGRRIVDGITARFGDAGRGDGVETGDAEEAEDRDEPEGRGTS